MAKASASRTPRPHSFDPVLRGLGWDVEDFEEVRRDLIEVGLITPPLSVFKTYLGQELSARIEPDGRMTFEGETYNSPSFAASRARASVKAPPAGRRWHTNGWEFWQLKDEDGRSKELDVLRQRYLERQALATTMSETIQGE